MICLTACQAVFYLKLDKERAKFIRLFYQSMLDVRAFLVINIILCFITTMIMHVLGATFDDGTNYSPEYDADYPLLPYVAVMTLSTIRNTIGDLQPPTYNYWSE